MKNIFNLQADSKEKPVQIPIIIRVHNKKNIINILNVPAAPKKSEFQKDMEK